MTGDQENTPPRPSRASTAGSSSPWKRHIAMLTDAKETAQRARKGEEKAWEVATSYKGEIEELKTTVQKMESSLVEVIGAVRSGMAPRVPAEETSSAAALAAAESNRLNKRMHELKQVRFLTEATS